MFGEHVASVLAQEWCHRVQYFYNEYLASGTANLVYHKPPIAAYTPTDALAGVLAGLTGPARARADSLCSLVPASPSSASAGVGR